MEIYKNRRMLTGAALLCTFALTLSVLPVHATDSIESLESQTSALENELAGINQDILDLSNQISDTEMQIEILNSSIDKTQDDLLDAEEKENKQYEDMKTRIKYMYENGNASLLEMLFSAKNMTDFLNKADFIENLSDYDRQALTQLQDIHQEIADQKEDLENQQASMQSLSEQLKSKQTELQAKAVATSTDLDTVNAKLKKAKEELDDASQLLSDFEEFIGDGTIYAQGSGLITEVGFSEDEYLETAGVLISYATSDAMTVSVDVSEEDVVTMKVGDSVTLAFTAYEDETYEGIIQSITTTATSRGTATVSYPVVISIQGDTSKLYEGMTADVTFITEATDAEVIYVPRKAIVEENGKYYIYKKEQDEYVLSPIETGFTDGENMEWTG